jgi:UDP-N-acetylmuramate: L-alanyl-gamma-D-glutamyl-meso-diaminopimelate ligase
VKLSFRRLINIIPSQGRLFAFWDDPVVRDLSSKAFCPVESFGLLSDARWSARSIEFEESKTRFEALRDGQLLGEFEMPLAGSFNVKNCLAAMACVHDLGVSVESIARGLREFKNVKRRLEIRGQVEGITVLDDFAHHPTAIHETLVAVRARYPQSRIWAIFEPRSATSRRNVFQREFAQCFGKADRVVLCSLFAPERLQASERLDVSQVTDELNAQGIHAIQCPSADEIVRRIATELKPGDKVVIMSNGGFDGIHQKLIDAITAFGKKP